MSIEQRLQRLTMWNRVWGVLTVLLLLVVTKMQLDGMQRQTFRGSISIERNENGLRCRATGDYPFIITHLVTDAQTEPDKGSARLDPLVISIDSAGAWITQERLSKLQWLDYLGRPIKAPSPNTTLRALSFRPDLSRSTARE